MNCGILYIVEDNTATTVLAALRAQGLTATSPLKSFYDLSGDLGGRIMRDKLWFYTAQSRQKRAQGVLGFVSSPGPDGRYLTGDEPPADNVIPNVGGLLPWR